MKVILVNPKPIDFTPLSHWQDGEIIIPRTVHLSANNITQIIKNNIK